MRHTAKNLHLFAPSDQPSLILLQTDALVYRVTAASRKNFLPRTTVIRLSNCFPPPAAPGGRGLSVARDSGGWGEQNLVDEWKSFFLPQRLVKVTHDRMLADDLAEAQFVRAARQKPIY